MYVLFNVQRLLVGGAIVPYILAYKSQNLRQNLAQKVGGDLSAGHKIKKKITSCQNTQLPTKCGISNAIWMAHRTTTTTNDERRREKLASSSLQVLKNHLRLTHGWMISDHRPHRLDF